MKSINIKLYQPSNIEIQYLESLDELKKISDKNKTQLKTLSFF